MSKQNEIPTLPATTLQRMTAQAMAQPQRGAQQTAHVNTPADEIPHMPTATLNKMVKQATAHQQIAVETTVPELSDSAMNSLIAQAMAQPQAGATKAAKLVQTGAKIVAFPKQNWRKSLAAGGFAVAASVMVMLTVAQPTVNADTLNELDEFLFFETMDDLV